MRTAAIILAAGQGKRMNAGRNKQFLCVKDKPILAYTIEAFVKSGLINQLILVINPDDEDDIKSEVMDVYFKDITIRLGYGGAERYHSVYNGLQLVHESMDYVLIHDGARPLVTQREIRDSITALETDVACVLGVKAKNTYKLIDDEQHVIETIPRAMLYSILTPQSFHKDVILDAYEKGILEPDGVTDDGMMVERFTDHKVKIIDGSYENLKVTTPDDLITMDRILESRSSNAI